MKTTCVHASSEKLTLYYYGEVGGDDRREIEAHLATCHACAAALSELQLLRAALAPRAAATRTPEEWNGFMGRLDEALAAPRAWHAARHSAPRTWHVAPHVAPRTLHRTWHLAQHVARGTSHVALARGTLHVAPCT